MEQAAEVGIKELLFADAETFKDSPAIPPRTGSSEKLLAVIRWLPQPKSHPGAGT